MLLLLLLGKGGVIRILRERKGSKFRIGDIPYGDNPYR
jgi:hypothetical protein